MESLQSTVATWTVKPMLLLTCDRHLVKFTALPSPAIAMLRGREVSDDGVEVVRQTKTTTIISCIIVETILVTALRSLCYF